ncbi:hypothetical protein EX30DRAFT_397432 [Ascodesmis nigricans]|uniref:Uncharacterized protein n=1 Tax=Ascodesmis nigricans TaxID=341454 RepID=A0A4S2MSH6_9PEZI|nr:hypothetical protein EX30DRAFT_397432 [Ascodesmis nigricans]
MAGGNYGSALIAALRRYEVNLKFVELLLESGADVNMKSDRYGSAPQAAPKLRQHSIYDDVGLIDIMDDPNVCDLGRKVIAEQINRTTWLKSYIESSSQPFSKSEVEYGYLPPPPHHKRYSVRRHWPDRMVPNTLVYLYHFNPKIPPDSDEPSQEPREPQKDEYEGDFNNF